MMADKFENDGREASSERKTSPRGRSGERGGRPRRERAPAAHRRRAQTSRLEGAAAGTEAPLAVVTGASSGLGAILSVQLAQRGYDLVLVARTAAALHETAARVLECGRQARVLSLDLCREGDVRQLEALFSREPISLLVNNAGIGHAGLHAEMEPSLISTQIRLNAEAVARLAQAAAHAFVRRGEGRILNMSSLASFVPVPGFSVYAASKAFIRSFSLALSSELRGTGVSVTVACPGYTRTPFLKKAGLSSFIDRLAMEPERVCREILDGFLRGDALVVTGLSNKVLAALGQQLPPALGTWISSHVFRYQMSQE